MDEKVTDGIGERQAGRRTVIKGAAAGVAAVWAAPVVSSVTSPAYAAGSVGNPNPECIGANCDTFGPSSSANPDCVCTTTATGGGFCVPGSTRCDVGPECGPAPGFSCPDGSICVVDTCCGFPVCTPLDLNANCPPITAAPGTARAAVRQSTGAGTIGG